MGDTMEKHDKCPVCGESNPVRVLQDEKFEYCGESLVVPAVAGWECSRCGEAVIEEADMQRCEKLIRDFHERVQAGTWGATSKARVLALDVEKTLITSAVTQWPRPGLYDFLQGCKSLFERIVVYTTIGEGKLRSIAQLLAQERDAPEWFKTVEYVEWSRRGKKDLFNIPGVEPEEVLIVDDHKDYIVDDQLSQWVFIEAYEHDNPEDKELSRVLSVLEAIQSKSKNGKSPFEVPAVKTTATTKDILDAVQESRERR